MWFTVTSGTSSALQTYSISIDDAPTSLSDVDPFGPFRIDGFEYVPGPVSTFPPGNEIPLFMFEADKLLFGVSFIPAIVSATPLSRWIEIHSNDHETEYTYIELRGRGTTAAVVAEPHSALLMVAGIAGFAVFGIGRKASGCRTRN